MRLDLLFFKVRHKIPTVVFVIGILYILASRCPRRSLITPTPHPRKSFIRQAQRTNRAGFYNDQLARRSKLGEKCSNVSFQESSGMLYFEEYQLASCGSESNVVLQSLCTSYYKPVRCKQYSTNMFQELRFKTKDFFSRDRHFTSALVVADPFIRIAKAYTNLNQSEGYYNLAITIMSDYRAIPFSLFNTRKDILLHDAQRALFAELSIPLNPEPTNPDISHNPYLTPLGPTFEEFVLYLLSGHLARDYLPLTVLCAPCSARFDYILKNTDKPDYLAHFTSDTKLPSAPHPSSSSAPLHLFSDLPDHLLSFFHKVYQNDCEMFDLQCEEILDAIRDYRNLKDEDSLFTS